MKKSKNARKLFKSRSIGFKHLFFILSILVLLILALILVHFYLKEDDRTEIPISGASVIGHTYHIGEVCEINNEQNSQGYIVFNEVVLTNEIEGEVDSFLIFSGEIDTNDLSFPANDIYSFHLDLRLCEDSGDVSEIASQFSEELSQKLSDAELRFNGEEGAMRGKFSLVFSIEKRHFELIKGEVTGSLQGKKAIAFMPTLKVGFDKTGYRRLFFKFAASDIKYN